LVVLGDEVTKILSNSLFTYFTEQGKTGKTEIESKENHAIKMAKKPKNKVSKICNEPA
jgi:hypothetical protein